MQHVGQIHWVRGRGSGRNRSVEQAPRQLQHNNNGTDVQSARVWCPRVAKDMNHVKLVTVQWEEPWKNTMRETGSDTKISVRSVAHVGAAGESPPRKSESKCCCGFANSEKTTRPSMLKLFRARPAIMRSNEWHVGAGGHLLRRQQWRRTRSICPGCRSSSLSQGLSNGKERRRTAKGRDNGKGEGNFKGSKNDGKKGVGKAGGCKEGYLGPSKGTSH